MKAEGEVEVPEETGKKLWSVGRIICAVMAVVSFSVTVWIAFTIISNPFHGPRSMHLFLMMASSAIFTNMFIVIPQSYFLRPKGLSLFIGAGKWALTIALPFFLMASVNSYADKKTLNIAREELSPVIDFIDTNLSAQGTFPGDILEEVKKIERLTNVTYIFDEAHFVMQTKGSSIDMDGATIFYISSDKEWCREHNDIIEAVSTKVAKRYREATNWNTKRIYRVNSKTGQWEAYEE